MHSAQHSTHTVKPLDSLYSNTIDGVLDNGIIFKRLKKFTYCKCHFNVLNKKYQSIVSKTNSFPAVFTFSHWQGISDLEHRLIRHVCLYIGPLKIRSWKFPVPCIFFKGKSLSTQTNKMCQHCFVSK